MKLDTTTLRELLDSSQPEQRVWAIWALALRQRGTAELAHRAGTEPDAGVRRALAVVLAGHGETALLVALARHDPAIKVRASAMQLVTRLAAAGRIDQAVVIEAAESEPEVQTAILRGLDDRAPELLVAIAEDLLQRGDEPMQVEAFEALVRVGTPTSLRRAIAWLGGKRRAIAVDAWQWWARTDPADKIVRALVLAPFRVQKLAFRVLRRVSWSVLEPLISDDQALLVSAAAAGVPVPIDILARLVLEVDGRTLAAMAALAKRLHVLSAPTLELLPLLPRLHAYCKRSRAEDQDAMCADEHRHTSALSDGATFSSGPGFSDGHWRALERGRRRDQVLRWLESEVDRLARKPCSVTSRARHLLATIDS